MAVSTSNPQESTTQTNTLSAYAVPAGDDKILFVFCAIEANTTVSEVTHNGVALTKAHSRLYTNSTVYNAAEIWYLLLGSTTPSGDIVVTWASGGTSIGVIAVTGLSLAQTTPEATADGGQNTSPINTVIATATNGALILDCLSCGDHDPEPTITQGPDQVLINSMAYTAGSNASMGASYRIGGTAGNHTLGWSQTTPLRMVQALVSFAEETGGGALFIVPAGVGGGLVGRPGRLAA